MKFKFRGDQSAAKGSGWAIDQDALSTLDFRKFSLIWADTKPNTLPIEDRMNNSDNLINVGSENHIRINNYSKYNHRVVDGYHVFDIVPVENILEEYQDWKVEYRYNTNWFRSDNFKKEHDGLHIVFSGCSNTEGIGTNIENTWSHMIYSDISEQTRVSGYFNLAKAGSGWHTIIQNFHAYVNNFSAPDYLVILMPNILRSFTWSNNEWKYQQLNPWHDTNNINYYIEMHRKEFPVWALMWYSFIDYCKSIGTTVIWSTWDEWETENINGLEQFEDTFFSINPITQKDINEKYAHLLDRRDASTARDGHDGYIQQTSWYEAFKNKLIKDGVLQNAN
jgi:hypothetical protein